MDKELSDRFDRIELQLNELKADVLTIQITDKLNHRYKMSIIYLSSLTIAVISLIVKLFIL